MTAPRVEAISSAHIAGAEKKLRQARFFLDCLTHERPAPPDAASEVPEYYFSACLSAAQSAFYALDRQSVEGHEHTRTWRNTALLQDEREQFNWMTELRDDDVHQANLPARPLPKMVPDAGNPWSQWNAAKAQFAQNSSNAMASHVNPDQIAVDAPVLRGTVGLYLTRHGQEVEATTVCRDFIARLSALLDCVKARHAARGVTPETMGNATDTSTSDTTPHERE